MRTIRISSEVWDAIAERGKFGETPDDVLRRVLLIRSPGKRRLATYKMFARVRGGELVVQFKHGPSRTFPLPPQTDKGAVREVRRVALDFVKENSGTLGQQAALKKALTDAGYHIAR